MIMKSQEELNQELYKLQHAYDNLKKAFDKSIAQHDCRERELRESVEKYQMLIENLNEILYQLDENGIITYISPNIEAIGGYTPAETIGKCFVDFVHPEDKEGRMEQFFKILSGVTQHTEYRMLTKEGRSVWMRTSAKLSKQDDQVIGVQGVLTDITDLKESEKRFNTLISQTPAIIYSYKIINGELQITYVSENITKILGYAPEELIGNTELYYSCLHPDDLKIAENTLRSNIQVKDSYSEYQIRDKKGIYHWLHDEQKVKMNENGEIEVVGASWDITDRRNAEKELARQKQFFEQMFMQSALSTQILDSEGWCERINPKLSEIFGVSPHDIEGKVYNIFMDEEIKRRGVIPYLEKVFKEGMTQEWEVIFDIGIAANSQNIEVKEKKKVWFHNWAFPILDEDDKITNVIIQHMDITSRKQDEEELIKAKEKAEENNRLKSAFLNNLSHEIRTPMNAIVGFASLLRNREIESEQIEQYTSIIDDSAYQLLSIVDDILEMALIESKQVLVNKKVFNLDKLMGSLYDRFKNEASNRNIDFKLNVPVARNIHLYSDQTKLRQIIVNLLVNAFKFTIKGEIDFGCEIEGENIRFFVKDTGIGISNDLNEKIFDRFFKVEDQHNAFIAGCGLGLSISKGYVELLGGNIWVESSGRGWTEFCFTIPLSDEITVAKSDRIQKQDKLQTPHAFDFSNTTILIAEDEKYTQIYLEEILSETNARIILAINGKEAVDYINENPDIKIALLDIKMPGMDGLEAASRIKRKNKNVVLIAQTAYSQDQDREIAIKAGFDEFISKPIDRYELLKLIKSYIN